MSTIRFIVALLVSFLAVQVRGAEVFNQPPSAAGGVHKSSWYAPDGLDGDEYAFEDFTLPFNAAITQVKWRGGYTNYLSNAGQAPVYAFTIAIYRSGTGGFSPDLGAGGRLVRYQVTGNCGETAVGTFGGVIMYDYSFTLPAPFQAVAGTKYWMQIEASQGLTPTYYWPPDWGLCTGTGGNGSYFRKITGGPYQNIGVDLAMSMFSSDEPTVTIAATVEPAGAGTLTGAGDYPLNSAVQLFATANAGWGFVNWTENGSPVSSNVHYNFTATANRTLVANFAPAYTITTASYPSYAGTTSGDGVYTEGSTVTVTATPKPGFVFSEWQGLSSSPVYSFPAMFDVWLSAMFVSAPNCVTFDLDNAPVHTSLPIGLTVNGLSAYFSATDGGFSIQPYGSVGLAPAGMSGLYLFPNTVFRADLIIEFSEPLTYFSILYSPQELGCDDSATMRVTATMNGVFVGTDTATVPQPGTYPTGTLKITTSTGFNKAVVHYDSPPPTCQDWGPIFLADIVTVTRVCAGASVGQDPAPAVACMAGPAAFSVTPSGTGPFTYAWRFNGVPIDTMVNPSAASPVLAIESATDGDAGSYDCDVSNNCGSYRSGAATLEVLPDLTADGFVDTSDLVLLLGVFGQNVAPGTSGDINGDGVVNTIDLVKLLAAFGRAC